MIFFSYKKASKGPQVSTDYFKVNFGQRFGLCQENSCTHETLDYQYEWQKLLQEKRRIMPMALPETQENERATSKYHECTDTNVSSSIAVVL